MRKAVPMLEINKTDSERRGNCSGHLKSPLLTALFTTCGKPRFSQKPSPSKSMQKATETVLCFDRLSFAIKT
ncbi:hypothetical protein [Lactobacillus delbrueckii]|uniref:hypothetical protein n=1 Tax=Lactobacillus delbrueckii TaxID=1584 RepID=UPI001E4F4B35|nr:hypothetical protein [Lactobacillus delbrueckii]MCD5534739.1 hypothetical protein [Lactobacillus delbrueckii subsp. sunkii]